MLNIDTARINLNNIINNPKVIALLEDNFDILNNNMCKRFLVSDIKNIIQVPLFAFFDDVASNTNTPIENLKALEYLDALVGVCIFNKINIALHKSNNVNTIAEIVNVNNKLSSNDSINNCIKSYVHIASMLHIPTYLDPLADLGTIVKKFIYSFVGFLSLTQTQKQTLLSCKTTNVATIYRVTLVSIYDICIAIDNLDLFIYIARKMLKHYYLNALKYKGYLVDLLAINYKVITHNSDRNALRILNEQNDIVKGLIESTL